VKQGAIMQLQEPAWCTNPLSVAVKWDTQAGKTKKRVVLDLSRHVNWHAEQYGTQSRWTIYRQQKAPGNRMTSGQF
jgi:hypothetical protein